MERSKSSEELGHHESSSRSANHFHRQVHDQDVHHGIASEHLEFGSRCRGRREYLGMIALSGSAVTSS